MFGKNSTLKIKTKNGWDTFSGIQKIENAAIVKVILEDGTEIECTPMHRFSTPLGFKEICKLDEGDVLETEHGYKMIARIIPQSVRKDVYDVLDVGIDKSYYTNGILSHNCEFLGSAHTLISGAKLRQLEQSWVEPIETKEQTHLRIYERPVPGHTYAVTVDVATGLGGDAQALSVIDVTNFPFKQVAVFDNNHLYYMLYPQVIANVATWYNEAFVLIEINDVGQAVSYMMQVEIGYDNLIKIKPKGKQGQQVSGGFQKLIQYGLKSTTATKRIGCAALKALVETDKLIIQDFKTVHELMTFVEDNESFAADESSSGAHDDIAMTLVLFGWLSDQQFFKDSVGNNIRTNLERQLRAIEDEDFVPFGFFVDNVDHTYEDAEDAVTKNPTNPWLS